MFLSNKYKRWYYQIIDAARKRGVPTYYYEEHHVVPKCMGGNDAEWNMVKLTFREHYLVHWLLTKMTDGDIKRKMYWAFSMMAGTGKTGRVIPSWLFSISKVMKRKAARGYKHTAETRANMSKGAKGKIISEATRLKMSNSSRGKPYTDKMRANHLLNATKRWESESGHPNWRKCSYCKNYDDPKNLYIGKDTCFHKKCRNKRSREKYKVRKLQNGIPDKGSAEVRERISKTVKEWWVKNEEAKIKMSNAMKNWHVKQKNLEFNEFREFTSTYGI